MTWVPVLASNSLLRPTSSTALDWLAGFWFSFSYFSFRGSFVRIFLFVSSSSPAAAVFVSIVSNCTARMSRIIDSMSTRVDGWRGGGERADPVRSAGNLFQLLPTLHTLAGQSVNERICLVRFLFDALQHQWANGQIDNCGAFMHFSYRRHRPTERALAHQTPDRIQFHLIAFICSPLIDQYFVYFPFC